MLAAGSGVAALGALASLVIYRPYFIGLAGLALVYSFFTTFWAKYRAGTLRPESYQCGKEEVALGATTLLVLLVIFLPYLRGVNPADGERLYEGSGAVLYVDESEKRITLQHGEIEKVMPAMTMDYDVEEAEMLSGLKPGEVVRFGLKPRGFDFVVVQLRKEGKK